MTKAKAGMRPPIGRPGLKAAKDRGKRLLGRPRRLKGALLRVVAVYLFLTHDRCNAAVQFRRSAQTLSLYRQRQNMIAGHEGRTSENSGGQGHTPKNAQRGRGPHKSRMMRCGKDAHGRGAQRARQGPRCASRRDPERAATLRQRSTMAGEDGRRKCANDPQPTLYGSAMLLHNNVGSGGKGARGQSNDVGQARLGHTSTTQVRRQP